MTANPQPQEPAGGTVDLRGAAGVQVGDGSIQVNVFGGRPPSWTRSGYVEQVRDIAPAELIGRDGDLADLAAFCAGDDHYLFLRAGPWAGKSALLSTFVLHPPPQVDVVSFFVTARLAEQSDARAFTDMLIDQLSALAGESIPAGLGPGSRDASRRALLTEIADRLHRDGRRLVLVVDGLDEDRGGRPGSGTPSIASLLPRACGDGLRVIVSGRSTWSLPDDVPAGHPLRGPGAVRVLESSPDAVEIAARAGAELQTLLHGSALELDMIGFIATSGGGLRLADLAELTGEPLFRVKALFGGLFRRTVTELAGSLTFAHETLRETAVDYLGTSLSGFRSRLHAWADTYREASWPDGTPPYLLRGYPLMLADAGDAHRLVALVTDPRRHDRMLALTGGDSAAHDEITLAEDLLLSGERTELAAMCRLNIRRSALDRRNAYLPPLLPAVWARLGAHGRAEAMAIAASRSDAASLGRLAKLAVEAGDHQRAERLVLTTGERNRSPDGLLREIAVAMAAAGDDVRGEALAHRIADPAEQAEALVSVVRAISGARRLPRAEATGVRRFPQADTTGSGRLLRAEATGSGRLLRAEAVARATADSRRQAEALRIVAVALHADGDHAGAEVVARSVADPLDRASALCALARASARAGGADRARLAAAVEAEVQLIGDDSPGAWWTRVEAVAAAGDYERARGLAVAMPERRDQALAMIAGTAADNGDYDEAEVAASAIPEPLPGGSRLREDPRELARGAIALAAARAGHFDRVDVVTGAVTRGWVDGIGRQVVMTLARAGQFERAEALVRRTEGPLGASRLRADLVVIGARAGRFEWARRLGDAIRVPGVRMDALSRAAAAAGRAGDRAWTVTLIGYVESTVDSGAEPGREAGTFCELAAAAAAAGDRESALRLAGRAAALAGLAGRPAAAARPGDRAAAAGAGLRWDFLAEALTVIGEAGRAEALAEAIGDPRPRAQAFTELAWAAACHADQERAERLAVRAEEFARTVRPIGGNSGSRRVLVEATALAGAADRAARVARAFGGHEAEEIVARVLAVLVRAGDRDSAQRIACLTEGAASRARLLAILARAALSAGDRDQGLRLVAAAEESAAAVEDPESRAQLIVNLARTARSAGDSEGAFRLVASAEAAVEAIRPRGRRTFSLLELAAVTTKLGDQDRALRLMALADPLHDSGPDWAPWSWTRLLVDLAGAAEDATESLRRQILTDVLHVVQPPDPPYGPGPNPSEEYTLARARIAAGRENDADLAIDDVAERAEIRCAGAVAAARRGDPERARHLISDIEALLPARLSLIRPLTLIGEYERAEQIARSDGERVDFDPLRTLASALTEVGEWDRAEAVALEIQNSLYRIEELARIVIGVSRAGDQRRAGRVIMLALRSGALSTVVDQLVLGGLDSALCLLHEIDPAAVGAIIEQWAAEGVEIRE
ncbi:hypothetical protein AB0M02_27480 [Actinoplanes sp. NPDC051861]|uniref:hypothetical protein n=1 Tax=Actinoplanes sp. NPDC051861 TaxID=3155170 RepID=UPI003425CCAB